MVSLSNIYPVSIILHCKLKLICDNLVELFREFLSCRSSHGYSAPGTDTASVRDSGEAKQRGTLPKLFSSAPLWHDVEMTKGNVLYKDDGMKSAAVIPKLTID